MRKATIYFAIYMVLPGLGLMLLTIYVNSLPGILLGLLAVVIGVCFYFVEKGHRLGNSECDGVVNGGGSWGVIPG